MHFIVIAWTGQSIGTLINFRWDNLPLWQPFSPCSPGSSNVLASDSVRHTPKRQDGQILAPRSSWRPSFVRNLEMNCIQWYQRGRNLYLSGLTSLILSLFLLAWIVFLAWLDEEFSWFVRFCELVATLPKRDYAHREKMKAGCSLGFGNFRSLSDIKMLTKFRRW